MKQGDKPKVLINYISQDRIEYDWRALSLNERLKIAWALVKGKTIIIYAQVKNIHL